MDEHDLLMKVLDKLWRRDKTLSTAESCTGGMVARMLTEVPNSSLVFWGGVVTYSNQSKTRLLAVQPETLKRYGAVSPETAREMVLGMLEVSGTDYAVSITGIAGPGGGTEEKPVGLVYIAVAGEGRIEVKEYRFLGDRGEIRRQTSWAALELLWQSLP
ncbi:MAG: CinA family protein [Syntrophomonadaceae bacterium]|nr:CinA family protein [Syntrophomonadaceae bacterium]